MTPATEAPRNPLSSRIGLAIGLASTVLFGAACNGIDIEIGDAEDGSGVAHEEMLSLDLDEVNQLQANREWIVAVEVGDGPTGVEIEIDDNFIDLVDIEVDGDRLTLDIDGNNLDPKVGFNAVVKVNSLTDLTASGASVISVTGTAIELEEVSLSGASRLTVESVDVDVLDVGLNGASSVVMAGSTIELDLRVDGASEAKLFELSASTVDVNANGASTAEVFARDRLTGSANGASLVVGDGSYDEDFETSGASTIRHR